MEPENKIKLENRIVCFIDILGFADIIANFEQTQDISIIEKIQFAFDDSLKTIKNSVRPETARILNMNLEHIELLKKEFLFKTFSDNIIISVTFDDNNYIFLSRLQVLLTFSNIFQYSMTSQGVYTRGGISYGTFYSDDNIIFSDALVKAYLLESKTAIYPRIVIDKKIIDRIIGNGYIPPELSDLIYLDWENIAFLTPFSMGDKLTKELEESLSSSDFLNDPTLKDAFENIPEAHRNIALKPYTALLQQYEKIINDVILKSTDVSYPEHIRNKYVWLIEFYKWKYQNESGMLHFKMLPNV